eukprot:COSAG05_NODE_367_length_10739_cov_10.311842_8_plen_87_part_00
MYVCNNLSSFLPAIMPCTGVPFRESVGSLVYLQLLSLLAAEGELPPTLAEVLRNSFDPALTNGCTAHNTYEPGSVATISTEFLVKG